MESAVNHRSGERVPQSLKPIYEQIVGITDAFCHQHIDSDYATLCMKMAAALARKRSSQLTKGHTRSWAGAIICVLGRLNFLFDKSQRPHMTSAELCSRLGVSMQTLSSKACFIENTPGVEPLDPRWCVPSLLEHNSLAWMIVVDGFAIDARNAPREISVIGPLTTRSDSSGTCHVHPVLTFLDPLRKHTLDTRTQSLRL
jgi:hypothetical protein